MSIKYKFWDAGEIYFTTFAVVEWIDVFTRNEYREIVINSIRHCIAHKGLQVHAWVLMSNHVHMVVSLNGQTNNSFSDIMRDMKKFTAMHLIKAIKEHQQESRREWMLRMFSYMGRGNANNTNFQFWRQDNHPIQLTTAQHYNDTLHYIHENPVMAGWTMDAIHYPWSSAKDYAGFNGMLPIVMLD